MNDRYLARSSRIAARKLGGEMVIMSAEDSSLYTLNEVGTVIWEAADGRTPLAEIIERVVCAKFDVDPSTALRDAEEFVEALTKHKILLVSGQPIENPGVSAAGLPIQPSEA